MHASKSSRSIQFVLASTLIFSLLVSCPEPTNGSDPEAISWVRFFSDNPGAVVRFGEFEATMMRTDNAGSGTFSLLKDGAAYMDAVITATIDEPNLTASYEVEATQVGGPTINWTVTVAQLDQQGCQFEIGVFTSDGATEQMSFIPYNFCTGLIGVSETEGDLPAAFAASRTQDPAFDWLALQKLSRELMTAAPIRIAASPTVAAATNMSFLGCLTACATAGGLSGWCASAVVDGVGATCCNPVILPLLVKWLDCIGI